MRGRGLRSALLPCLQQSSSAKGRSSLRVGSLSQPGPQIKVHGGLGPCHHHGDLSQHCSLCKVGSCMSTTVRWKRDLQGRRGEQMQTRTRSGDPDSPQLSQGATPARPSPGEGIQPSSHKPIHVLGLPSA